MKLPDGYTPGVGVVKASGFGGFGQKILQTYGWKEGMGLGKDEQGMANAIEIRKKDDQIGVGAGPDRNWNAWWENAFDAAAKGVRVASSGASSSTSDDGSEIESDSDREWEGEGAQRGRCMWKQNRDGTVATGSTQELRLLESLAKAGGRVAAGRFGGRDAKMERIRRQEELEAQQMREKLGLDVGLSQPVPAVRGADGDDKLAVKSKVEVREKKEKEEKKEKKEKKKRKMEENDDVRIAKAKRIVIECGEAGAKVRSMPVLCPTPIEGWWGSSLFRSAGALDSTPLEKKANKDAGFTEDQQAKLYETAQLGKTTGKTGLGKGKRGTIKIEGAVWKGTKTTFDDDHAANADEDSAAQTAKDADGSLGGKSSRKEKRKQAAASTTASVMPFKWKKVVKQVFKTIRKKDGGRAKLKSLHKEVRSHVVAEYQVGLDKAVVKAEVEKCISASFAVSSCGKYVSLCS